MFKQLQKSEIANLKMESTSISDGVQGEAEIDKLNNDCLNYIFGFLQVKDKVKIEQVCKRWQEASKDSWKNIKTLNENPKVWGFDPNFESPKQLTVIFDKVLQRCGSTLTHVDLSSLRVQNIVLYYLAKTCRNLQSLNAGELNLTPRIVKSMTANWHDMREITFTTCTKACNDDLLSKFFSKNKKLRYLKITGNENLTGKFLESLPRDSIETIIVNDCAEISADQVIQAVASFENLQALSFMEHFWNPVELKTMVNSLPKKIVELRLSSALKLNTDMIGSLTNLQILNIPISQISDTFLTVLAKYCKELLHLNISGCVQVTDAGMQEITSLPKLETLDIANLNNITDQPLKYLPKLKKLTCAYSCKIKDDGLCTLISSCDSIELLDCKYCINITNNLVDCAIKVTKLRKNGIVLKLDVRGTSVDSESITEKSPLLDLILPSDSHYSSDLEIDIDNDLDNDLASDNDSFYGPDWFHDGFDEYNRYEYDYDEDFF